jgi:hypothetical protein
MVETKCIKRPPFGIIKIVLNSYCQLIRTVTPNKEEVSWQKIIATQVKILRMDSIHRRKKIRVRTEIQHLIQVRIRIPVKILIQISKNSTNCNSKNADDCYGGKDDYDESDRY